MSKRSLGWREGLQAALNRDGTDLFRFTDTESAADYQNRLALLVGEETPHGFHPRLVCGLDGPDGAVLGRMLTRNVKKPYYVSVGHLIALEDAFTLADRCVKDGRVLPLGIAHDETVRLARKDGR